MTDQPGETPAEPTPESAQTPSSSGAARYDFNDTKATLESANRLDLGIVAAGLVALIGSWLPFYTWTVGVRGIGSASGSLSAWHGFFGWFAVLVALATSVAVALELFKVVRLPMPLHQVALAGFGLSLLLLILTLIVDPSGGCNGAGGLGIQCDIGRGVGFWLAVDFTSDKSTKAAFTDDTVIAIVNRMYAAGVIANANGTAFELAPPYTISRADLDLTVGIARDAIVAVAKERGVQ